MFLILVILVLLLSMVADTSYTGMIYNIICSNWLLFFKLDVLLLKYSVRQTSEVNRQVQGPIIIHYH